MRTSTTTVAALVDTNVLVYRCDPRYPEKRRRAAELLRKGVLERSIRIPHQAVVEFVSVVTRRTSAGESLLTWDEARRAVDEFLSLHEILLPNEAVVRLALRGEATYRLSWYDAHLWAYAEHYGLDELLSEDFEHGRIYGSVRAINPFL